MTKWGGEEKRSLDRINRIYRMGGEERREREISHKDAQETQKGSREEGGRSQETQKDESLYGTRRYASDYVLTIGCGVRTLVGRSVIIGLGDKGAR